MSRRASPNCLRSDEIADLLAVGRLSPRELEKVRLHLPHCLACRDAIRAHARPPTQAFILTRQVSRSWPRWLAVVTSFGALGASAWWGLRGEPPVAAANVVVVQHQLLRGAPTDAVEAPRAAPNDSDVAALVSSAAPDGTRGALSPISDDRDAGRLDGGAGVELDAAARAP